MFWQGVTIPEIATALDIERRTVYNWSKADDWKALRIDDTSMLVRQRLAVLLSREKKGPAEMRELDRLLKHCENMAKIHAKAAATANGARKGTNSRGRKAAANDFSGIDEACLMEKFMEGLFAYQVDLWNHRDERNRNILKSRQIGLTWYFAREAFADLLLTGKNKVFISASRAQADYFRDYIQAFAKDWFDIDLVGKDKIKVITPHGVAYLYFLSTSASTAQGGHGDVYVDEYFWMPSKQFKKLKKVVTGAGSQKMYRKTYFSTPSAKGHPAYGFWSGDDYNEENKRSSRPLAVFPDRDQLRAAGQICPDCQWRKIITIHDALAQGCNRFDLEQLKGEYTEDEFRQLFECYFVDDSQGCFRYSELEKCLGDSKKWPWFHPDEVHPYKGPVWIGYDPSRVRDGACVVVLTAPSLFKGKMYVLERINMKNAAWEYQAATIKDLCSKYFVEHIGVDVTGPGSGVFEKVQRFFPAAEKINYSLEVKSKLVLKAQQVIAAGRLEWDSSFSDIAAGFLLIHRSNTQNGNITYVADRSDLTGHADAAWAIMHALFKEELILPDEEDEGIAVIN